MLSMVDDPTREYEVVSVTISTILLSKATASLFVSMLGKFTWHESYSKRSDKQCTVNNIELLMTASGSFVPEALSLFVRCNVFQEVENNVKSEKKFNLTNHSIV